jgi:hypothetical protein
MRGTLLLVPLALGLAGGCRTSDPEAAQKAAKPAVSEPVAPAPPPIPPVPVPTAPPPTVAGFDFSGPVTCLPLATGRTCLSRKDPVADACAKAKGEVLRCDDCSTVCSRPL